VSPPDQDRAHPKARTPARRRAGNRTSTDDNAQVNDLGVQMWSYLPLTRTRYKLLTCGFATPWLSPARCEPRDGARRLQGARATTVDDSDITVYREGTTAASLIAAHGLSLKSVKRLLDLAGARLPLPTQRATRER
jgi:hypothetical protein